jgi:TolB-like protein/class 3 adenylate cyclase
MEPQAVERRLTTILAADIFGYSRLMGMDEAGTLAALRQHRNDLVDPKAAQYGGRIVKHMGDGTLMEFASVVDAVAFAVEVQRTMAQRNAGIPEDRRIVYRIGINVGDIMVEGDDIYGDGVNVAARLEGLAEAGGICIRRNVRNQVRDKLDIDFEDLGEVEVKNIARPIRASPVVLDQKAEALRAPLVDLPVKATPSRLPQIAAAFVLCLLAVGVLVWWQPWAPEFEPASVEAMAFPLPDQPSIAVLPFNNLSEDAGQDYFADGMTENLITDLSKISGLFVIARISSFSYKGRQVKVRQVAEDLGVRCVLEGSVRRAGEEVRINAQLIDATTGGHIWAERYDGSLSDVFELQDKVTLKIITALAAHLTAGEEAQRARMETNVPEAYDAFLRGWAHYRLYTREDFAKAVPYLQKAVQLDLGYSRAYAALAAIYRDSWGNEWVRSLGISFDEAWAKAKGYLAAAMKHPTPLAHQVATKILVNEKRWDEAIAEAERAIALNANDPDRYAAMARVLIKAGRPAEGLEFVNQAMRLDPESD